jgi:hypothetical protein
MGGTEAVMQIAGGRAEAQRAGMRMFMGIMAVPVGMRMGMAMFVRVCVIMSFDSGFAFAAAADSTHSQTPEFTRPTNP